MEDPAARAEKAAGIFGRGWAQIAPFILEGGDAIRENTAAIDAGLVVTEEAAAKNDELRKMNDELNDSWTALANQGAQEFLPVLLKVVDGLQEAWNAASLLINWNKRLEQAYEDQRTAVTTTSATYEDYVNNIINATIATGALEEAYRGKTELAINSIGTESKLAQVTQLMTRETWLAVQAAQAYGDNLLVTGNSAMTVTPQIGDLNGELTNTAGAASAGQSAMAVYSNSLGSIGLQIATINGDIAKAQEDLSKAQADWSGGVAQTAVGLLDEQKLGAENYQDALSVLDDVLGTSYLQQEQLNTRLEEANAEYAKSGDLEAYRTALEGIKEQFMPMAEQVQQATDRVIELEAKLNELNGKQVDILINIQQQGGVTLPGGANAGVPVITPPSGGGGTSTPSAPPPTVGPLPYNPQSPTVTINAGSYSQVDASRLASQIATIIQGRQ